MLSPDASRGVIFVLAMGMLCASGVAALAVTIGAKPEASGPEPVISTAPATPITLPQASFSLPASWERYGPQDDASVVRVRHFKDSVRLQVATLTTTDDLEAACEALVADQSADYEISTIDAAQELAVGAGSGVTCGFSGSPEPGDPSVHVSFNMARRDDNGPLLLVRQIVGDEVALDSPALADLAEMSCEASRSFDTAFPLC